MQNEPTLKYTNAIWSSFQTENILWDSFSGSPFSSPQYSHLRESPLRFILNNKNLRWAWYLLLINLLLFLVIQSKRKQAPIPVLPVKKNNSLEYIKAIAALYYQSKNHKPIAEEMIQQLYSFIKARYNIKIGKNKDTITPKLARVSGISTKQIEELFRLEIKLKYDDSAESDQLAQLFNSVDYFYKNCK